MSSFWSGWIIILTLTCLALVVWVLFSARHNQRQQLTEETTGHNYDGIEELDNPLPHWWFLLFIATLVFGLAYLLLYPGLGKWQGLLGWSATGELKRDQLKHSRRYAPEFARYAATPIDQLIDNPKALKMGQRIYINNCALCHASDARGGFGFPDLTDKDWLYGGTPAAITTTLLMGRQGQMPAWGALLGEQGVSQVSQYVRSLSGLQTGASSAALAGGRDIYETSCSVCHGADGTGNQALGAPNLTDDIWLYGSSPAQVSYTIRSGRNGVMPAWKAVLGEEKVHLVAAYVYSLSARENVP